MAKNNAAVKADNIETAPVVAETQEVKDVAAKQPTKSELIRSMYNEGMSVANIAKELDSHYSFVYGVVKSMLGGEAPTASKGPSRADNIRSLYDQGLTPGQIAKELNANYSYVHTVCKKYKESQGETK